MKKKYYNKTQEIDPIIVVGVVVIISLYMIWTHVIKPIINWLSSNLIEIAYGIIVVILIVIIFYIFSEKIKKQHEEKQRVMGLIKFTDRFNKEKWGTPQEVELWINTEYENIQKCKEIELKESLFYRVIISIEKFKPSRMYKNEFGYHTELQGWLKHEFPESLVEIQTGASRPDIIINNIAIEIKGPTSNRSLDTLSTKCLKYTNYYTYLIIVLFEPYFSESHYNEIVEGIERNFPDNVKVVRKD